MADNEFVRSPGKKIALTPFQISEIIKCCNPIDGHEYFMRHYFYIQHPTRGKLLYDPYAFQIKLINNYHNHRFSVSMMPRQTGKCLLGNTCINIRNNKTGKEYELPIGLYYQFTQAQRDGTSSPDISAFEVKNM